jgi:hypothetical protein
MAAGNQRKSGLFFASQKTRVQGVTGDQTVKNAPALLHRLLISNADAAVQTVTIKDGATTLNVVRCPAGQSFQPELYIKMGTSLIINPSNANLDVLVAFD